MKPCATCGEWKPDADYYPDRRPTSKDGLHPSCKPCARAYAAANARKHYLVKGTMSQRRDDAGRFVRGEYA